MRHLFPKGKKHPNYKGDEAGIVAIHEWVKGRKPKPQRCEECNRIRSLDLANKSGKYLRSITDWNYICRRCHMRGDGRSDALKQHGIDRTLPDNICKFCKKAFHPEEAITKFCSSKCYRKARTGITPKEFMERYT